MPFGCTDGGWQASQYEISNRMKSKVVNISSLHWRTWRRLEAILQFSILASRQAHTRASNFTLGFFLESREGWSALIVWQKS